MAATAFSLRRRRPTSALLRRFSSVSPPHQNPNPDNPPQSSFSSYFDEVRASLAKDPPENTPIYPPPPRGLSGQRTERASPDQIRRGLSEFRLRNATGDNASPPKPFSFQEFYQRNAAEKERELANQGKVGRIDIKSISENLRQFRSKNPQTGQDPFSLNKFRESLNLQPSNLKNPPFVMGFPQKRPQTVEMEEKDNGAMKTRFVKMYSYKELGEKLRKLRPEGEGFSLLELNERLVKLREMEEREATMKIGNGITMDLRRSLLFINQTQEKKKAVQSRQALDFMSRFSQTPAYMEEPPKDHLIEKYFHVDNMSSAEKLKIELQKVRDEFKMSESDCGSARVQVAQLTTKIKHLTTALHKKDTHSRKGLQGMIQQRKKLLKYLRRTDWESYILVLSKFGLRDNPDHKRLPTKEKKKPKRA